MIDIADAVVAELESNADFAAYDISRAYVAPTVPEDLTGTRVTVVGRAQTRERITRDSRFHVATIAVVIQRKLASEATLAADADAAMLVTQSIMQFLEDRQLTAMPSSIFQSVTNDPVFAANTFHENRIFMSILDVVYQTLV